MKKVINYFFDEEEYATYEPYIIKAGAIILISLIATLLIRL